MWANVGQRPLALLDPRYEWTDLYGFVHPTTGDTEWFILPRVNGAWFNQALATFAKQVGAGPHKRILLVIDGAGWHTCKDLVGNVLDLWNRQNRWERLSPVFPMVLEPICCPGCHTTDVVKHGKSAEGKQRYRCRNAECTRASFILNYSYRGYLPEVKQQIADMAVNGSGIRDTARVLKVSPTTVIEELKKTSPA